MTKTKKTIALIGSWLALLLLPACSSATPTSTPTIDLDPVYTQAAETVFVQVSQTLAAIPTDTPVPSPTSTLTPSPNPSSTPSATAAQTGTPASGTPATPASGTPEETTTDQAEWVAQSVSDGTVFAPGASFTMVWELRNVGTSTWTTEYALRFYTGNAFGASQEVLLDQDVAPGETVEIPVSMTAPNTPGDYRSDWVMSNEERSNFNEPVFLEITVAAPATNTPTTTATSTATP